MNRNNNKRCEQRGNGKSKRQRREVEHPMEPANENGGIELDIGGGNAAPVGNVPPAPPPHANAPANVANAPPPPLVVNVPHIPGIVNLLLPLLVANDPIAPLDVNALAIPAENELGDDSDTDSDSSCDFNSCFDSDDDDDDFDDEFDSPFGVISPTQNRAIVQRSLINEMIGYEPPAYVC